MVWGIGKSTGDEIPSSHPHAEGRQMLQTPTTDPGTSLRRDPGDGNAAVKNTDAPVDLERVLPQGSRLAIILTGTDPEQVKGGIGSAVAGYRHALTERGLFGGLIPTFKSGSINGKWWPWIKAIPTLYKTIRRLRKDGRKVVVYGHAGPRFSMFRESLILLWARLWGARTMLQLHTPHIDRYLDKAYARLLMRAAFLPVDRVTVLSPWWQSRLSTGGFGATVVIPNPLSHDLEIVASRKQAQGSVAASADKPREKLTVLAMARLTRGKGVHVAVEALKYLPEHVVLRVAGDGPELTRLKALARSLGVSHRAQFLGWVSGEEKIRELEEADVFCAPSKADAFSMSVIEALSHGLPVVTVRSRAIIDLVKDGETGFVVEVDDTQAVARAIRGLDESGNRARMGAAAAKWVMKHLSADVVGKRIEEAAVRVVGDVT